MTKFDHEWAAPATELPAPSQLPRFRALTEEECDVVHWALTTAAARILEDAGHDRLGDDPEILSQAGGVFALASAMARELDLAAGRPNAQDTDSIAMAAACIAEHQAPEAMRMSAETVEGQA